jgi:hypothetical protein
MKAVWARRSRTSDLSIAPPVRQFKALVRRKAGCKPTSTAFRVFSVLTARALEREVTDTSLKASGAVDRDATRAQRPGLRGSRNDVGALQSVI